MSTVTREFNEADRYLYDNLLIPLGFAQVDTDSDASWFGTWAHPGRRVIFNYCEADCTTTECESAAEFISEMQQLRDWHRRNGQFLGVDPGTDPANRQAWIDAGGAEFLEADPLGLVAVGTPQTPAMVSIPCAPPYLVGSCLTSNDDSSQPRQDP